MIDEGKGNVNVEHRTSNSKPRKRTDRQDVLYGPGARALVAVIVGVCISIEAYGGMIAKDTVFDMRAIINDPLDARTLKVEEKEGIVLESVEFTSDHDLKGNAIRTFGILAYPRGAKSVPGIVWGQSGMADAGVWFPELSAKKGYACISVTLAKDTWHAFAPFDTAEPRNGNLVRLAVTHMRAITYLCSRPEVDAGKIGIGGASYGGVYATLAAGADPRVKAGMSFFAGGNHHLGTNLPQFNGLKTMEDVEVFKLTADGARRFRYGRASFLWGIASNDHWFHLPAVVATYADAIGDCRMAILPNWAHGFTPEMDQQLIDWFDVHLLGTRKPYNDPGKLVFMERNGGLFAEWTWTGDNAVKKADVVVSYGRALPWCGWVHRYHHSIPAKVKGQSAAAQVPVPDTDLEIYAYGNIVDENDVLTSTIPVSVIPSRAGVRSASDRKWSPNCFPLGAFEPADTEHLERCALMFGAADASVKHTGEQSIRMNAAGTGKKQPVARMKLLNVYERGHKLSVWLRASAPAEIDVKVAGVPPQNWNTPAVKAIVASIKDMPKWTSDMVAPVHEKRVQTAADWTEAVLDCPFTGVPVEGYELQISQVPEGAATYWIDDVRFEPVW